jgi:hypothetical protein
MKGQIRKYSAKDNSQNQKADNSVRPFQSSPNNDQRGQKHSNAPSFSKSSTNSQEVISV